MTHYKNTDLVIESESDLTQLSSVLESRGLWALSVNQLEDGRWRAVLESDFQFGTPEANVLHILAIIQSLDGPECEAWAQCVSRVFDLGFDCGDNPFDFTADLSGQTMSRIGALGADVRITIYRCDPSMDTVELTRYAG